MPEKLLTPSTSPSPGIVQMQQLNREKRRTMSVTWLCCAVALIALVLVGFAFLIRNFIGHWPSVNTSFLSINKHDLPEDLPIYPYLHGNSYDTAIPGEEDQVPNPDVVHTKVDGIAQKPITTTATTRESLFSENERVRLDFIRRQKWGAVAARRKTYFGSFAIARAVIMETGTESCSSEEQCMERVREIQRNDMEINSLDDIRYNFLIGGDGSVFEGRGFNAIGQHTPNFNNNTLGIALIGKFNEIPPTGAQVRSLQKLLQFGIAWEYLKSNYEIFGYDQLVTSEVVPRVGSNPGAKLFAIIKQWPHWTENSFYKTN